MVIVSGQLNFGKVYCSIAIHKMLFEMYENKCVTSQAYTLLHIFIAEFMSNNNEKKISNEVTMV